MSGQYQDVWPEHIVGLTIVITTWREGDQWFGNWELYGRGFTHYGPDLGPFATRKDARTAVENNINNTEEQDVPA